MFTSLEGRRSLVPCPVTSPYFVPAQWMEGGARGMVDAVEAPALNCNSSPKGEGRVCEHVPPSLPPAVCCVHVFIHTWGPRVTSKAKYPFLLPRACTTTILNFLLGGWSLWGLKGHWLFWTQHLGLFPVCTITCDSPPLRRHSWEMACRKYPNLALSQPLPLAIRALGERACGTSSRHRC